MMSKLSLLVGASCLLLGSIVLSAQDTTPSFIIEDTTVDAGERVSLDVVLMNYDSILGTTFSLLWDSTMLDFVEVSNIAAGMGSIDDNFNINMASSGELRYLFVTSDLSGGGISLADNTVLFTLNMDIIAEPAAEPQMAALDFGGLLEIVDVSETAIQSNFDGAMITIRGVVDTEEVPGLVGLDATVTPNPFSGDAQLTIEAAQQEELTWQLSDVSGRLITQGKANLLAGQQILSIAKIHFKHTGTYLLTLQAGEKRLTRQLYFIENR